MRDRVLIIRKEVNVLIINHNKDLHSSHSVLLNALKAIIMFSMVKKMKYIYIEQFNKTKLKHTSISINSNKNQGIRKIFNAVELTVFVCV